MESKNMSYDDFVEYLADRFGESPERIKEVEKFSELGLDSLSLFSLLTDVEDEMGIRIEVEDLTEIDSVEKMYAYITEGGAGQKEKTA